MYAKGAYKKSHQLIILKEEFENIYPEHAFDIPPLISGFHEGREDLFGKAPDRQEGPQHERFRYYADRQGNPWPKLETEEVKAISSSVSAVRHFVLGVFIKLNWKAG